MAEITRMSSRGQVVIPLRIRAELELSEGSTLIVDKMKNFIVLKKVPTEELMKQFKELTKEGEKLAKDKKIFKEEDVVNRIHKGRSIQIDKNSPRY